MDLPELPLSPSVIDPRSSLVRTPRSASRGSISSLILKRIFVSPRKRPPQSTESPSRPHAKLVKRAPAAHNAKSTSDPTRPKRKHNPAIIGPISLPSRKTTTVPALASPNSSFYSSTTSSTTSVAAPPAFERDSLASLLKSLATSPPHPHAPRRPLSGRAVSPLHFSQLSLQAPSWLRAPSGISGTRTFICAIHCDSSTEYGTAESQCISRIVTAGGSVLEKLVPGGFM